MFLTAAYWDEKDKRVAIAQIMRLADVPEVNSWEPPLEREFGKTIVPLANDARLIQWTALRLYPNGKYAKNQTD